MNLEKKKKKKKLINIFKNYFNYFFIYNKYRYHIFKKKKIYKNVFLNNISNIKLLTLINNFNFKIKYSYYNLYHHFIYYIITYLINNTILILINKMNLILIKSKKLFKKKSLYYTIKNFLLNKKLLFNNKKKLYNFYKLYNFFLLLNNKKKLNFIFKWILIEKLLKQFNFYNKNFLLNKKIKYYSNNILFLNFKFYFLSNLFLSKYKTYILYNNYYFLIKNILFIDFKKENSISFSNFIIQNLNKKKNNNKETIIDLNYWINIIVNNFKTKVIKFINLLKKKKIKSLFSKFNNRLLYKKKLYNFIILKLEKKLDLIKKKKIIFFKKKLKYLLNSKLKRKNIIFPIYSQEKKNYHFSFLVKYLYLYYLFHKNKRYKYINNLFFYYLNNKKINKINLIKNNIYKIKNKKKKKFLIYNNIYNNKFNNIFNLNNNNYYNKFLNNNYFIYNFFKKKNNSFFLKYLYHSFLSIKLLPYNKIQNIIYYYNKSFIVLNWIIKKKIFSFLNILIFIIKYFFYIYIKKNFIMKKQKKSFLYLYANLINNLINNNIISNYINESNNIISFYIFYNKKIFYINYIEDIMLLSIFQNNSFYYYYLKYYILNFLYLFYFIENTISKYSNTNCYLLISYSLNWKYMLNNAKMWCEYLVYNLKKKNSIRKMFFYIKKQQIREKRSYEFTKLYGHVSDKKLLYLKYPLKGIRILYSGNFKKAKRKKKLHYYIWLSNSKFTGQMPLKKFKYYIDYHYSVAVLRRSSIGIKFWLLFNIF